jgi:hypothetical protein
MNDNIKEYLKVLEEECGENKCQEATHVDEKRMDIMVNPSYARVSRICEYRADYKWRLRDRFKNLWKNFLLHFEYLSKYNPFDFKSYQTEWNPYGFDKIYTKFSQTSTPWTRLKKFSIELKGLYYSLRDAFFYTPYHIQHYQGNKKRIGWFEKNIWCWFSGSKKEKATFEDKLRALGYTISKNKDHIYYEPK